MAISIPHTSQPISRALLIVRSAGPRLIRFGCTGLVAGMVQLTLLHLWTANGWDALVANPVALLVSAQLNFLLSATFIWRDRRGATDRGAAMLRQWVAFHAAILGTALLNQAVFAVAQLALPALPAAGLGIAAGALVNFLVQDRFIFTARQAPAPERDAPPVAALRTRLRSRVWARLPAWGQRLALRLCAPRVSLGACAVIRDPRGRVLVAYHPYRHAWGLPGGFVEPGEQPDAALYREIVEELHVSAAVGPLLAAHTAPVTRHLTLYYAATIADVPCVDGVEMEEFRYVEEDELPLLLDHTALVWLNAAPTRAA